MVQRTATIVSSVWPVLVLLTSFCCFNYDLIVVVAQKRPAGVQKQREQQRQDYKTMIPPPGSTTSSSSCDLYMAESSIPNAGIGVYAGRDYQVGERIGNPTVGIPLIDLEFNRTSDAEMKRYGALPEFLWESHNIGGFHEALHVDLFIPGAASLVNHHSALDNVIAGGFTIDRNLQRSSNPMAGSFSAYGGFTLLAKRAIKAGEELFVDKSSHNDNIQHPQLTPIMKGSATTSLMFMTSNNNPYQNIQPTTEVYEEADNIIKSLLDENANLDGQLTDAQWIDLLYRLKTEIITATSTPQSSIHDNMLAYVLSSSLEDLKYSQKVGGIAKSELRSEGRRTVDWILNNGQCLDGITEGKSILEDAGRGAFATTSFEKGSTIAVSPLMQIADKAVLDISPPLDVSADSDNNNHNSTKQLLINFCFGHRKSKMLLCPTTHAALINHHHGDGDSKGADKYTKKPNVAIRWWRNRKNNNPDLTAGPLDGLGVNSTDLKSYNSRLFLEYVALADISEGDEILLDYGKEYEDALSNHIGHGTLSTDEDEEQQYVAASKLMENASSNRIPVIPGGVGNHGASIVHQSHIYECEIYPNVKIYPNPTWEEFSSNRNVDKRNWPSEYVAFYKGNDFASWYPCQVVESNTATNMHSIELFVKPLTTTTRIIGRKYRNVPGNRIRIADGLYQSDQHLKWAFRHYLPIPDSIFPLRWREDYQTANSLNLGSLTELKGTAELEKDYEDSLRQAKCGLYLAKSNIPNAGFGLYTAVDIPASNLVVGSHLAAVPMITTTSLNTWPGKDYVWSSQSFKEAAGEDVSTHMSSFIAGLFGALANAHTGITNMKMASDSSTSTHLLDRASDPGAGAYSSFCSFNFRSAYAVKAGEELFVSYGEEWFSRREKFNDVPLRQNFDEANSLLAAVWAMASLDNVTMHAEVVEGLLQTIREHVLKIDHHRTRMALSAIQTLDDLRNVLERNGTAAATVEAKSSEWLEENGYCLDHIYVKGSTIKQAGLGAFSRRALKEGTILISAPAIAVSRNGFKLPDMKKFVDSEIIQTQLMMNYHFGHKNSSLLFFPLTQAANINHNSKRKYGGQEPNARVQFSTAEPKSRYILGRIVDDIKQEKYSAVVMDFIATRDINPDEEIFIDYGQDWEDAWNEHIEKWSSPCRSFWGGVCTKSSKVVAAMNQDKYNSAYHPWTDDHFTICRVEKPVPETSQDFITLVESAPSDFFERMKSQESYEGIGYSHEGFALFKFVVDLRSQPCVIVSSSKSRDSFSVLAFALSSTGKRGLMKIRDLQSKHLQFRMKPFKSDMYYPQAFRHEISIPDEAFPSLWKDLEDNDML